MMLSDREIIGAVERGITLISPFNPEYLQPASVDLHLDEELKTLHDKTINIKNKTYHLKPNEFILASTFEYVRIPIDLVGHIEGRSSFARLGLMVHITAGFIDSGYEGNITLELYNCSDKDIKLKFGDSICQIAFEQLTSPCLRPYGSAELGSKYQYSEGCVRSKL